MSQLQPHLLGDRPRWSGELQLRYDDGDEWLQDMGLLRRRLGWEFFPCDDIAARTWAYVASDNQQDFETWVTFHLPVDLGRTLPTVVQAAFKSGEGRTRFAMALNAIAQEPLGEVPSRWARLTGGGFELEDLDDGD